jgi:hypothetical protein
MATCNTAGMAVMDFLTTLGTNDYQKNTFGQKEP